MSIGHWRGCARAGLPHERRIELRVGIHLGAVVEKSEGDPMGDGVNIAARLEALRNQVESVSVSHNLAFVSEIRMSPIPPARGVALCQHRPPNLIHSKFS
jgi:hypothetical protein